MLELKLASQDLLNLIKKGIDEIKNNPSEFDTFDVKRFMAVPENDLKAYFNELEKERKGIDLKERFVPQSVFWLFEKKTFYRIFGHQTQFNRSNDKKWCRTYRI